MTGIPIQLHELDDNQYYAEIDRAYYSQSTPAAQDYRLAIQQPATPRSMEELKRIFGRDRDQQARDRLRNRISESKAKIESCAYLQLGEKALQTVHQTFEPNIPVILHLPALTNTTVDTDTILTLFVIQEGIHCMSTTDYYFKNIQPEPIIVPPIEEITLN